MIHMTYGDVQVAGAALAGLSREGLRISIKAALKWKRILGVLQPLLQQMEEQRGELVERFARKDENGQPIRGEEQGTVILADPEGFSAALQEMYATPVQVGCDLVELADFGTGDEMVNSRIVELLAQLGPLFDDGSAESPVATKEEQ